MTAGTRWAVAITAGGLLWVLLLVAAPAARRHGGIPSTLAAALHHGAGAICHQRPERSFHLAGVAMPVCARCTGLYLAGAAAALAAWAGRRTPAVPRHTRRLLAAAAVPMALSVGSEMAGLAAGSNAGRMLSALPLGAAAGWIVVRSLRAEGARPGGRDAL